MSSKAKTANPACQEAGRLGESRRFPEPAVIEGDGDAFFKGTEEAAYSLLISAEDQSGEMQVILKVAVGKKTGQVMEYDEKNDAYGDYLNSDFHVLLSKLALAMGGDSGLYAVSGDLYFTGQPVRCFCNPYEIGPELKGYYYIHPAVRRRGQTCSWSGARVTGRNTSCFPLPVAPTKRPL